MSSTVKPESNGAPRLPDHAADAVPADEPVTGLPHPRDWPTTDAEVAALAAIQARIGTEPVLAAARGLSHFGEHALGWIAIGGLGALVDRRRRRAWLDVAVGAVGAHAASIVVKRVVRRPRPHDPSVSIGVSTPSRLSFPSSHATSTAAAAVLIARAAGLSWGPAGVGAASAVIGPMVLSRLVLGVHYPTDVLAGTALGVASAAVLARVEDRTNRDS